MTVSGLFSPLFTSAMLVGFAGHAADAQTSFFETFREKCVGPIVDLEARPKSEVNFDQVYLLRWVGKNSDGSEVCLVTQREDYQGSDGQDEPELAARQAIVRRDLKRLPDFHAEMEKDGWALCWDRSDVATTNIMFVKGNRPGPRFGLFSYFHPEFATGVQMAIRSETTDASLDDCTGGVS